MPRVRFIDPITQIVTERPFMTPKSIQSQSSWVTAICKVIPDVPNPRHTEWDIKDFEATLKHITITLGHPSGMEHILQVDRNASFF